MENWKWKVVFESDWVIEGMKWLSSLSSHTLTNRHLQKRSFWRSSFLKSICSPISPLERCQDYLTERVICFFIQIYLPSPRICSFHFIQAQILSSPRGGGSISPLERCQVYLTERVICFFIQFYLPSPRICSFHFVQAQILSSPRGGRINVRVKMVLK